MRERNNRSGEREPLPEHTMKEAFVRISLQLAHFHSILQEMRLSKQRVFTYPDVISATTACDMKGFPACKGSEGKGSVW